MDLSRTEINGDFSQKPQIFPPRVFCEVEGVPLELGTGARGEKN